MGKSDWHEHRPVKDIISASARMLGRDIPADPWRELAVAVIGNALCDLDKNYQPGNRKIKPATLKRKAWVFLRGPDLEIWSQMTSIGAKQWREIAKRIAG